MAHERIELAAVLSAAEAAAPVASLDVVARNLRDRFGARYVSFLFVDLVGQRLVRFNEDAVGRQRQASDQILLAGSLYDQVLRTQRLVRAPAGEQGQRVIAPVTNRGDTIGVLELSLPQVTQDILEQVEEAAHALAYIVVTDRRFTDLYHWGQRTTAVSLAAEIQRQLLPTAPACEAPQFSLACALVPAGSIAGDTYDYALDRDTLHLSITDAMGHDVNASLMATLLVNASRGARRAGADLAEQARRTHRALLEHGRETLATGLLLRIALAPAPNSSTPDTRGRYGCARARSRSSNSTSACPSASTYRPPTRFRTSTCARVTASCCTPTACRNAGRRPSTFPT